MLALQPGTDAVVRPQREVQVRAWIVNEYTEVLLVPHGDAHMGLPGGPADVAESDQAALVAHVYDQIGLSVYPLGLLGMDRLHDARHVILLCARVSSGVLATRAVDEQLHRWVRADTAGDEMPPRRHRQFLALWRAWDERRSATLNDGRSAWPPSSPLPGLNASSHL